MSRRGNQQADILSPDRSDTTNPIKQIKLSVCTVHAEWHISDRTGQGERVR